MVGHMHDGRQSSRGDGIVRRVAGDLFALLRGALAEVRRRPLFFGSCAALIAAVCVVCMVFADQHVDELIRARRDAFPRAGRLDPLAQWAGALRHWGRGYDSLTCFGVVLALGIVLRKPGLRRTAAACAAATLAAAVWVNAIRAGTGRPRPRAEYPGGWVGPSFEYKLQSFPSGHSAASFASATAIAAGCPPLGVPALCSAAAVTWASLYTRNHYLSDVLTGAGAGILTGLAVALAARRRSRPHGAKESSLPESAGPPAASRR
jgi:undecaprenyl-diphosphatase